MTGDEKTAALLLAAVATILAALALAALRSQ